MSLILKGIDMPKEGELHLIISKNGVICGAEYPSKIKHAYPLNLEAQAIQIPKGHGNLKDDKEILARAEQEVDGLVMSAEHLPMVIEWILDKSDTFLEAEE